MSESSDPDAERVAFEAKVAFLERAVELLSQTVLEQGRSIHDLDQHVAKLASKLDEQLEREAGGQMRAHDDPPPHY